MLDEGQDTYTFSLSLHRCQQHAVIDIHLAN
jgi:hypothetical protein